MANSGRCKITLATAKRSQYEYAVSPIRGEGLTGEEVRAWRWERVVPHPAKIYRITLLADGHLVCDCDAGKFGKPCKHARFTAAAGWVPSPFEWREWSRLLKDRQFLEGRADQLAEVLALVESNLEAERLISYRLTQELAAEREASVRLREQLRVKEDWQPPNGHCGEQAVLGLTRDGRELVTGDRIVWLRSKNTPLAGDVIGLDGDKILVSLGGVGYRRVKPERLLHWSPNGYASVSEVQATTSPE